MDSRPRFSEIDGVGVGRIGFSMDWGGLDSSFRWTTGFPTPKVDVPATVRRWISMDHG